MIVMAVSKADKIVLILSNRLLDILDDIIYSTCIIIWQYLQNSVIAKSSWKRWSLEHRDLQPILRVINDHTYFCAHFLLLVGG